MRSWILLIILLTVFIVTSMFYIPNDTQKHVMEFVQWRENYDLTEGIIESDAHNAYIEIYLNDKAKEAYIEVKRDFPVGSEVFKPLYSDREAKHFARLVIMVKMQKGYDPDHGDWWYGVYDESGRVMGYEGRIPECISCHEMAKETDYMFSRSVMKKLKGIDTNEFEEYLLDDGEVY